MRYKISLGDYSGDGHNITEDFFFNSSLSEDELCESYRNGSTIIGFDLLNEVAVEYEDSELKKEHLKKLLDAGFDRSLFENAIDDEELYISTDDFFLMLVFFMKKGGAEDIQIIKPYDKDLTNHGLTGGYGLFY